MKIALDFDETVTRDVELWSLFVAAAVHRGHEVSIVTYRFDRGYNDDVESFAKDNGIPVIYCAGRQKAEVYQADVWIDDWPIGIPNVESIRTFGTLEYVYY